jgi:hypothetical protein
MKRAARGPAALAALRSSSKRSVLGKHEQVGGRQMEAARQTSRRHQHGGVLEVVRFGHRSRAHVVVGQQLDRAFGAAGEAATNST